ncbi:MAG: hypothetical protein LBJ46_00470 [Planctomycetota bacterium]|jgi:tetratricopeptide (TPR) repeat protein|nr:hypothetical protein [Planctomycetota bacterium]
MRGFAIKTLLLFAALAVAIGGDASAAARKKKPPPDARANKDKAYSLDDIMKAPEQYLEQEVFFYCRFATTTSLYKKVNTPFNPNEYSNFAVWPDKAILWDKEGARNVLPTLYVSKNDAESVDILRMLEKYELIAVSGTVKNKYAKFPWILVDKIERVELPRDRLCDTTVQHMQNGSEALACGNGGAAARHFETALKFGLPPEYYIRAYEQLAKSYLLIDDLPKAQEYLRLATEKGTSDAALHLALADVCLRMDEPEEAIAHCVFAIEKSGKLPQVYGMKGEARAIMGDFITAFNDLNVAAGTPGITPRERAMVDVRRARIYIRTDRHADAARVYAAVTEPGGPLAGEAWLHNEVGLFYESIYINTGDPRYLDSAYTAYEQAVSLNRLEPGYMYNQAEVEFRRQILSETPNFEKVHSLLEEIEQVEPDYVPGRVLLGRVLFHEGRGDEADQLYHTFADRIGDDPMALLALAEAYIDQGDGGSASMLIGRAFAIQPWNLRLKALGESLMTTSSTVRTPWSPKTVPAQSRQAVPYQQQTPSPAAPISAPPAPGMAPQPESYSEGYPESYVDSSGEVITLRPGDVIRIERNGREMTIAAGDLQASAPPASYAGGRMGGYPAGEVYLDEYENHQNAREQPVRPLQQRYGRRQGTRMRPGASPLDLGYYPREEPMAHSQLDEHEIGYVVSDTAYASVPAGAGTANDNAPRIPPPFSFTPDESPVIIDGYVSSPGDELAAMPVRNANLHRGIQKRRPAEIIEEDAVHLAPGNDDMFAMAAPAPTTVRGVESVRPPLRAEVVLPPLARGIGQDATPPSAQSITSESGLLTPRW